MGKARSDLASEIRTMEKFGVRAIMAADAEYPALLREIHDPPIVLYVRGAALRVGSAFRGSRGNTQAEPLRDRETAKKLSYQLAYAGLTIVSGLARGIDTAAHQAPSRRKAAQWR